MRRLSTRLDPESRAHLARELAERVVAAARPLPVTVVSAADDVVEWVNDRGLELCEDPGDLETAVDAGIVDARRRGAQRVVVAHGDLALVDSFAAVLDSPASTVVVVPDRRRDGTPVIVVPTDSGFRPCYGPASFERNCAGARRSGLEVHIVEDAALAFDVDLPEDVDEMRRLIDS